MTLTNLQRKRPKDDPKYDYRLYDPNKPAEKDDLNRLYDPNKPAEKDDLNRL